MLISIIIIRKRVYLLFKAKLKQAKKKYQKDETIILILYEDCGCSYDTA